MLGANSRLWQTPLAENSKLLTTSHLSDATVSTSSYARFQMAPEVLEKRKNQTPSGLVNTVCLIDDILVFTRDHIKHERSLTAISQKQGSHHPKCGEVRILPVSSYSS